MIPRASALVAGSLLTVVCLRVAARGDQDNVSSVRAHIIGTWELVSAEEHVSQELRSHYGEPDIERFTAAPDIGLTVEYGSDGQACQIVIERKQSLLHDTQAEKYMKPEAASKLIEEIASPAIRGREVDTILESMGCAEGRHQEYENAWISHYSDVCVPLKPERESRATVVFKRQACPINPYAQIHKED